MKFPLWATPERRLQLAWLLLRSYPDGCCIFGEGANCPCKGAIRDLAKLKRVLNDQGGLVDDTIIQGVEAALEKLASHSYAVISEMSIEVWKQEDRERRSLAWKREKRRLHSAALKKLHKRGEFDTIAKDIYLANRPVFEVVAISIDAFSQQRVAKVIIPSLFNKVIWVNLSGIKLSKNKLHKITRRPSGDLPQPIFDRISEKIAGR